MPNFSVVIGGGLEWRFDTNGAAVGRSRNCGIRGCLSDAARSDRIAIGASDIHFRDAHAPRAAAADSHGSSFVRDSEVPPDEARRSACLV